MRLRQILKRVMYRDEADVYRGRLVKLNGLDDYDEEMELVYEKVPCKLSQYGKELSAHRDDTSQKLTEDLRLTYEPEYEIQANDVLKIRHCGQEWELIAGEQFNYPTHAETSVRRRREAGQP